MADDPTPDPAPNPAPAPDPAPPPAAKWYEGEAFQPMRAWLDAKGMAVEDPVQALDKLVKTAHGAEKLLGRGADKLLEKPAEGANLAEWLRSTGLFGLPDAPEKYEIEKPELPKGVQWDAELEAEARRIAHEHGVPPAALNTLIGAYAKSLAKVEQAAADQLQAANAEMMAKLEADWGAQTTAKINAARLAAGALAQKAGLDAEGLASVTQALAEKTGDAAVVRLFASLADMMAEDTLNGGGGGGGAEPNTPAAAKAELARMDAPDGEFGKAYARGDRAEIARLTPKRQALIRIASGS